MEDFLNITAPLKYDNRITRIEYHSYNPYVNSSLGYNDEIRIPVQQQDLVVLPCQSFLYIEGHLVEQGREPTATAEDKVYLDNNGIAALFNEIRYELNGVEIDRCKNVGITTTMKNFISLNTDSSLELKKAAWDPNNLNTVTTFNYCIPLNTLLGFFEDYKRVIFNARHELILIRAKDDKNALFATSNRVGNVKIELSKLQWRLPHVTLDDYTKLHYLRILQKDRPITLGFRSWDLYEYPMLPATQSHAWSVKAATQLEKPRYIIIAFQSAKRSNLLKSYMKFDHCNLRDIKVYLNSEFYPYDKLNINFNTTQYSILYDMYSRFKSSYYNNGYSDNLASPLLTIEEFLEKGPFIVIDCARQNEAIKSGTVDVKVEFECMENVPPDTAAYCLIIHDRIVEYNPLTNVVRKLI